MKEKLFFILITFISVLLVSAQINAEYKFVGVFKCKFCHQKENIGNQYKAWSEKTHANAFKSLGTAKAKTLAASVGVDGNPQEAKACLICHTKSKYDAQGNQRPESSFLSKFDLTEGVQCEDCHGAGEKYLKKRIMKQIRKEGGSAVSATAKATGLHHPDETLCKQCHVPQITRGGITYKNPTYKAFNFQEQLQEIAHPIPN